MSDQISEKMARKLARQVADYTCYEQADQSESEARCMRAWRSAGLIKPSKLDVAREWVKQKSIYPTEPDNSSWEVGYVVGVRDAAERFEAAITEILEERE